MSGKLASIGASIALTVPWLLLALRFFREYAPFDRILLGLVGGIAATISLGYILAMSGRLDLYWAAYFAAFAAALVLWTAAAKTSRSRRDTSAAASGNSVPLWLLLPFAAILVAEAIPAFSHDFPLGWDPSFHCILARKILISNALSEDWRPFEAIRVNYTQGLHVLIAIVSRWSGQPVHATFSALYLMIQPLAAMLVFRLTQMIFDDSRTAVLAMVVYGFLCNFGSFNSYFGWGGLPTALGSLFFLTIIWISLIGRRRKSAALSVLLFGSLMLTHHLSAVISTSVMVFYIAVAALTRSRGDLRRKFLQLFPLTLLAYAFYIIPYAARAGGLGGTDVLRFYDEVLNTGLVVLQNLGYAASFLGIAGMLLSSRRPAHPREDFLLCWITGLLLGFCLLGYIYRFGAILLFGEDFTAFTPSRFLTVISYPLAIYAGYALRAAVSAFHTLLPKFLRLSLKPDIVLAAVGVGIALSAVPRVKHLASRPSVSPEAIELGRMVEQKIPEGGFVWYDIDVMMELFEYVEWISYLTWRPTTYTPIPASENRRVIRQKRWFFQSGDLARGREWILAHGFQGFVVTREDSEMVVIHGIVED